MSNQNITHQRKSAKEAVLRELVKNGGRWEWSQYCLSLNAKVSRVWVNQILKKLEGEGLIRMGSQPDKNSPRPIVLAGGVYG